MALAAGLLLVALCLGIVAAPLFRNRRGSGLEESDLILELEDRRKAIYQEARIVHHDHLLGGVAPAEYQERMKAYRLQAAILLREQEQLQELDLRLEEEIQEHRKAGAVLALPSPCPECGRPIDSGAGNCPHCGAVLAQGVTDG